ncbi:MAG: LPS-assembly protein LptD [Betaproteobacteria bacterium]|nr:LPS-assembly protein LptD [Betaproteobacteria bacterium]PWB60926.1 MAG: LPS-assembly protein LptD [Betaproteobacteria bacterium]
MARRVLPLVLASMCALPAGAQEGIPLRLERRLAPPPPRIERDAVRFLSADRITGDETKQVTATGNVAIRQRGAAIFADRLEYDVQADTAVATGNVRLERAGDTVTGPRLVYRIDEGTGEMERPLFAIPKTEERRSASRGSAERALLEGDEKSRLFRAEYTTCPVPRDDWVLRVAELEIDGKNQVGTAWNSAVHFLGVPILYSPWLSFPINNARKTGFLAPTLGSSGQSGFEFALPWYWNIAENQDATITPKIYSKRGLQVGGEYRYLRPTFSGQADAEFLPNDSITGTDRYLVALRHSQRLPLGLSLAVNAQKVSDNDYFRDLSTRVASTSQTNLPRDVIVGYQDDVWSATARAIAYQTLQDPLAPVTSPYRQLPQIFVTGLKQDLYGADWLLGGEYANYKHATLVTGQRLIAYPQVSLPLRKPWGYVTPKAGFHYTSYNMAANEQGYADATRSVPLASVDAGLFFDRPWSFAGRDYYQTLEPRLFYVYVPYRDQTRLPNFSTAEVDFGTNALFRENRFIGGDRVGDANQVTMAVTSRLVEPASGLERLKATLGQIYYFEPQRVTLDPAAKPREGSKSDLLALVTGQVTPTFALDASLAYDAGANRARQFDVAARYSPQPGRVLNAAYRFTRDFVEQVDISAQWPVTAGLNLVGRWNWSVQDRKLIEGLAGFEYNAGCWEIRAVAHRFITATQQVSTSFQIQLELSGLSRIGINPLETLRQNISGYRRSDEIAR